MSYIVHVRVYYIVLMRVYYIVLMRVYYIVLMRVYYIVHVETLTDSVSLDVAHYMQTRHVTHEDESHLT